MVRFKGIERIVCCLIPSVFDAKDYGKGNSSGIRCLKEKPRGVDLTMNCIHLYFDIKLYPYEF